MSRLTVHYRLVLPPPWLRLDLSQDLVPQVREVVSGVVKRLPRHDLPPDQVVKARTRVEGDLLHRLREAKDKGALDYYLPSDLMHGVQIPASFTVSRVVPNALADEAVAARVLAVRLSEEGTRAEQIGDSTWARTESVLTRESDDLVSDAHQVRKVEYLTPMPGDPRSWVIVTYTTLGDGTMDSEFTDLTVELFDAIMTTWRWDGVPDPVTT